MADFDTAFNKMISNEGGYVLHEISGDTGGQTFAGIAKNMHPEWYGWDVIASGGDEELLRDLAKDFYQTKFWLKINGDLIKEQGTANTIFDFAVNAGIKTASRLAQITIGVTPDGIIGGRTIEALNKMPFHFFESNYALAKIARYASICNKNKSQSKFLLGWINRTLKVAK